MQRTRVDLGRIAMVPISVLLGIGSVASLVSHLDWVALHDPATVARLVSSALVGAFYAMMVLLYLRRAAPRASTPSLPVKTAAIVATWLPFAFGYLAGEESSPMVLGLSELLLVGGMAWSIIALRTLGRSFSIVPQARSIVAAGPYSVVRHPVYLGELLATLGIVLAAPSAAGFGGWSLLFLLQIFRARHEERVLCATLGNYDSYRAQTRWRIVPGLV